MSNFDETLQTDQIDGAEFKFLGLEARFERIMKKEFLKFEFDFGRFSNFDFRIKF